MQISKYDKIQKKKKRTYNYQNRLLVVFIFNELC